MAASFQVSQDVLAILSNATIDGSLLILNSGKLERKDYVAVNKVLEAMGGKWNRKQGGHVFSENPTDLLDTVLITGQVTDKKKEFQQFYTPEVLAMQLVELADIQAGERVLEPSAGEGAILALLPGKKDYCEIDPDISLQSVVQSTSTKVGADFLEYEPGPIYDKIVANPPFTRQQDVDHVSHMIDCCKPGGRIVSIMSPGFTFRTDRKSVAFREKLKSCQSHKVTPLDAGTFKESGTMVKTVILVVNK